MEIVYAVLFYLSLRVYSDICKVSYKIFIGDRQKIVHDAYFSAMCKIHTLSGMSTETRILLYSKAFDLVMERLSYIKKN